MSFYLCAYTSADRHAPTYVYADAHSYQHDVANIVAQRDARANTDVGQSFAITRDDLALMRIALPPGENYTVILRYEDGVAEQAGFLISILSVTFLMGGAMIAFWIRRTR